MAQLKLELLKEEARDFAGPGLPPKVSPGAFFKKVIEIEDRQYVLVPCLLYTTHAYSSTQIFTQRESKGESRHRPRSN